MDLSSCEPAKKKSETRIVQPQADNASQTRRQVSYLVRIKAVDIAGNASRQPVFEIRGEPISPFVTGVTCL